DPAKGSRTKPPGGVTNRTSHRRSVRGLTVGCATPSTLGRSLLGALAWYLKVGKNRDAPPVSLYSAPVAVMPQPSPLAAPRGVPSRLTDVPLGLSNASAWVSSWTTFVGQRPLLTSFIAPLRPVPARQLYVPWPSAFVPKAGCGTAACSASAAP